MILTTLGGLELPDSGLTRPKTLLLTAYLALEGPQDRRRLSELFWPAATDARNRLSVNLSLIRKVLPGALEADRYRVRLELTTDTEALLDALDEGDVAKALQLYRGPFLEGMPTNDLGEELEEWILVTREFVTQRIQEGRLRLADGAASAGRFMEAARQAEAAYGLSGTVALEPETLQRLHTLLLAGASPRAAQARQEAEAFDLRLATTVAAARERLGPSPASTLEAFPKRATALVGRTPERRELAGALVRSDVPLLTMVGLPGAGKTRLAVQLAFDQHQAGDYPDGVHFVPLETVASAEAVPSAIATALDLPLRAQHDPLRGVTAHLREKRALLILDNFEHLAAGAHVAAELIRQCPHLRLVVTSRERLGVEEEWPFHVAGLPFPRREVTPEEARTFDAVALFVDRAARARPGYRLTAEDVDHVVEMCRRTEGNPLALELAATWVSVLPVRELVDEVSKGLDLFAKAKPRAADRQGSLRGVFEQCWARLDARERACLAQLAVFHGGFGREEALAVAGASLPVLASLVAKSLLRSLPDGRYDRHPLLFVYMQDKLAEQPRLQAQAQRRHAAQVLALAERASEGINTVDGGAHLERLESEHANVRAALEWADREQEDDLRLRLSSALSEFWTRRGHHAEAIHWLRKNVGRADRVTDLALYARSLQRLSYLDLLQGEYDEPRRLLAECLALHDRLGDDHGRAWTLSHLGMLAVWEGDAATARARYEEALGIARAGRHEALLGRLLNNLGDVFHVQGQYAAARRCYEEALARESARGDRQMTSNVLGSLGVVLLRLGDAVGARRVLAESLDLVVRLGIRFSLPTALEQFACLASATGAPLRAARLWGAAEALRVAMRTPLEPFERPQYEADVATARERVPPVSFADAWGAGRTMSAEEAVALARAAQAEPRVPPRQRAR